MKRLLAILLVTGAVCGASHAAPPHGKHGHHRSPEEHSQPSDVSGDTRALDREGEKETLEQNYRAWRKLTTTQKQAIRVKWHRYQNLSEEEKQRLRQNQQRWKEMPEEKRAKLREHYRSMRTHSSEERAQHHRGDNR